MAPDKGQPEEADTGAASRLQSVLHIVLPLGLILAVGTALRLYGLQWDDGQWLHPDERQIFFTVLDLDWPHTLEEALLPSSPLNPRFFAYGSLPIYLLKLTAELARLMWPAFDLNQDLHLIARPLAVLADLITICLTYRLARNLSLAPGKGKRNPGTALLAAALVSLAVIHVQQARFYTTDVLLTVFVLLTLTLAAGRQGTSIWRRAALGVAVGLALSIKISAVPLILVPFVTLYTQVSSSEPPPRLARLPRPLAHSLGALQRMILPIAVTGLVFVITQPYILIDWQTFLDHTLRESRIARGVQDIPYTIQFAGTLPVIYPVWQTALWGLGLPTGLAAWAGLGGSLVRWLRKGSAKDALLLSWAGPYFVITALLYTKYLRYMLPLVPILCIMAAQILNVRARRRVGGRLLARATLTLLVGASAAYALLFVRLYASPHSWIAASEWTYGNVAAGSTLAVEYWDMPLPLPLEVDGVRQSASKYEQRSLDVYDEPDGAAKWDVLAQDLAETDFLILASRRLYGSIPRQPDRYPVSVRYYDLLLKGELGYELAQEFSRGPAWLNPRVPPLSPAAPGIIVPDESFVVYDHPRAIILRNVERLSATELLRRLGSP
jgi:hypothetical protein